MSNAIIERSTYHDQYKVADPVIIFNDGDKNLTPIHYTIPAKPPAFEDTDGYGLAPDDQFWKPMPPPPRLLELMKKPITNSAKVRHLEKYPELYIDEINYILKEWDRIKNWYWFFNNGKQTWISPYNYFYLQYWPLKGLLPEFRMRDRKFFLFWHMVKYDYLCLGFNYPKHRQEGATSKVSCIRYLEAILNPYAICPVQSKDENHAAEVHEFHMLFQWRNMAFWFSPIWDGNSTQTSAINFMTPQAKNNPDYGAKALNSKIIYTTSDENALDGWTPLVFVHNDEVGKTTKANVLKRCEVQRPAMYDNAKRKIFGKMINTSTVDEMEKGGGKVFKKLCDQSHFHDPKRIENSGRTPSWLYNLFIPGWDGVKVDKYGFSDREKEIKEILGQRKAYELVGNIDSLIEYTRQFPLCWSDCWKISQAECHFNMAIIESRLEDLFDGSKLMRYGDFEWVDGIIDNPKGVRWKDYPKGSHKHIFSLSFKFDEPLREANQFSKIDGIWYPSSLTSHRFCAGGDPFKYDKVVSGRRSFGGGAVYLRRNWSTDQAGKDPKKMSTARFVCTYKLRRKTKYEYGEDMIRMCVWFGCKMNPEINVPFLWDHFNARGYGGFLYYMIDKNTGKVNSQPGFTTTGVGIQDEIFRLFQSYIEIHGLREEHIEILEDCRDIADKMTDYDLFVGCGGALMQDDNLPTYNMNDGYERRGDLNMEDVFAFYNDDYYIV